MGPAALPDLPDGGEDLPHLIRVDKREIDKMRIGRDVKDKISREIEKEIHKMDKGEVEQLLDVCYDLEMWNEIDVEDVRCELEEVLDNMRQKIQKIKEVPIEICSSIPIRMLNRNKHGFVQMGSFAKNRARRPE